jgi:Ca-activated chloride channel family protein
MSFDSTIILFLAPVLAVLAGLLAWKIRRARTRATLLWAPALAAVHPGRIGPWLIFLATLVAGIGAAGPRWGRTESEMQGRALNLAIGVDISRSMLAEDVRPNRLQRALGGARRLIQDARGDRLALIAFAGRSYILTPLTLDDAAVALQLDALDPDVASEGGTDLAAVLGQGRELLSAAAEGGSKVLVIFTDGETHGQPEEAAAAARTLRAAGVTLVVVAQGDTLPARIPIRDERGTLTGYKTDAQGSTVRTWRRDDVLRGVADAAGGILVGSDTPDQEGAVRRVLAGLERSATRERRREDLAPRGWLLALAATLLLGAQGILRRGPALAGILLAAGLLRTAGAQRPSEGNRLLRQGDTAAAAVAFAREAALRPAADSGLFNAGTAAIARGDLASAKKWLTDASRSLDPGLRFRALYNLGLVSLLESRRDTANRRALEEEAAGSFRDALLLQPGSRETKWNLELVQERQPPRSGGGGGATPPTPPRQAPPNPRPSGSSAISQSEAEQILNSVERTERDVRAEQARRRRVAQSSAGKDW